MNHTPGSGGSRAGQRDGGHVRPPRGAPDRLLSDDEWAHIATEIMHRTGLALHPAGKTTTRLLVGHALWT